MFKSAPLSGLGLLLIVQLGSSSHCLANMKENVGYNALLAHYGIQTPDGRNVPVSQVEAGSGGSWMPDSTHAEFSGKNLINASSSTPNGVNNHATVVGKNFYGNTTSFTPGITAIELFDANGWLFSDFLNTGQSAKPDSSANRIANHSWVGSKIINGDGSENNAATSNLLRRIDWLVANDEYLQLVGIPNSLGSNNKPLLSGAYNVIPVGCSDGQHSTGTAALDSLYTTGRSSPLIVAPRGSTSAATAVVSAAAALLIEAGHGNSTLSNGSTVNRAGSTLYNAERSEVIKALLLAGADRRTRNSAEEDISNYRIDPTHRSDNGLDSRYGAGQLNVYRSFQMQLGGEQDSVEDGNSSILTLQGFDYDPAFGGGTGSNSSASYALPVTAQDARLQATLVWNLEIAGDGRFGSFDETATLHDLNLELFDLSLGAVVANSASSIDNTENLYLTLLPGHQYELRISRSGANFNWDYALAWQLLTLEPPHVSISSPANASQYTEGDSIGFDASADDSEDGDLSTAINWLSSVDGALGSGAQLTVNSLTVGDHRITATVVDSDGYSSDSAIDVVIIKDSDGDGWPDTLDNCTQHANADQLDSDGDGLGDSCDPDIDGDVVINAEDNCPLIANPDQLDMDNDSVGNVCDSDRDGDGVANSDDNCPDAANIDQADIDGDAVGDVCDSGGGC